jgi:hypothetical protein
MMDGNDTKALEAMEGRAEVEDWSEETRRKKAIIHNFVHVYFFISFVTYFIYPSTMINQVEFETTQPIERILRSHESQILQQNNFLFQALMLPFRPQPRRGFHRPGLVHIKPGLPHVHV